MLKKYIVFGLVILLAILVYMSQSLHREYKKSVNKSFELNSEKVSILTLDDIRHLPEPVQKYLIYAGTIGKEKVNNVKVSAGCKMQMNDMGWINGGFEQYNFFGSNLTRLFYLKLNMFGFIPVRALHSYTLEKAYMLGKVFGLIPVVDVKGEEMRISDTATLLNDMCLFAPAALIDRRIQWESIDDTTAKAVFSMEYCTITALLFFNQQGELTDFTTEDRYDVKENGPSRKYKWSTPIKAYKEINGMKLASDVEAVWDYPEGSYCYFKMTDVRSIQYNCSKPN